jgi:hypothetical protein
MEFTQKLSLSINEVKIRNEERERVIERETEIECVCVCLNYVHYLIYVEIKRKGTNKTRIVFLKTIEDRFKED